MDNKILKFEIEIFALESKIYHHQFIFTEPYILF
jgi:hypothetical protein